MEIIKTPALQQYQQLIEDFLQSLDLGGNPTSLYEPIQYTVSLSGKRMRPLLVLIGAELAGGAAEEALPQAAGVELFHNFTLLHDDIMDEAPLRRGKPAVHQKFGTNTAILAGDALFVVSYKLISSSQPQLLPQLIKVFNETALHVCEGQQMDMEFENRDNVSIDDYLEMIRLKTATLLGASLQIGSIVAGAAAEFQKNVYDFGVNTGIAFQLQDDLLDSFGDKENTGKKVGGDIAHNKKTYLILRAIADADEQQQLQLQQLISEKNEETKISGMLELYDALQIEEKTKTLRDTYFNAGMKSLYNLDAPTEKKQLLESYSQQLLQRVK